MSKRHPTPLLTWDTCTILNNYAAELAVELDLSEDKSRERAGDSDILDEEWDFLCEHLTELMERKNANLPYWVVQGNNLGWDHRSGTRRFEARDGKELLRQILPKCDYTFDIFHEGRCGFLITNAHHDSPMHGSEQYHVRMATKKELEEGHYD